MRRSDQRQAYDELLGVIRGVRRRWRLRHVLRGVVITGATALVAAMGALWLLGRFQYSPEAAGAIRIGVGVLVALVAAWTIVRPLLRRVRDETVALYLEEHEPSLEAAVLSALESGRRDDGGAGVVSEPLLRRTLEAAIARCHAIDDGRWIEQRGLIRVAAGLVAVIVLGGLAGFLIPDSVRYGASLLISPTRQAEAATSYGIGVEPGSATVSRGADAPVSATLRGFDAELVELAVRAPGDTAFERLPMARGPDGAYGYLLYDLEEDTDYFIEAEGVRSEIFSLTVAELPYVGRLDLELDFPDYTGLDTRTIENGGDVTALRGTTVGLVVTPTLPVDGGAVVVDGSAPIPLEVGEDGALRGAFEVRADGFYHITLDGPTGEPLEASPRYVIDALSDGAPIVTVPEPGRDEFVTPIDEMYIEARAEDDYGIGGVALHFSVNGGEEQMVELYGGRQSLPEVTAGHTLYLEEYGLEPGDLITYYATAADNDGIGGTKRATSDIYFLQIRPFQRDYQAAEQGGAPPPGGGGQPQQGEDGDLTQRQKDIIAGTFNVIRDSARYSSSDLRENINTLALAQEKLSEDTRALAQRMVARQVTADTSFRLIATLLPMAAERMDSAATELRRLAAGSALSPEQRALQFLQRAEAVFREVQVQMGQQQGGQQGGQQSNAEDLADLFELEMDKLRDQYETVDRGGQSQGEQGSPELDETMERLKELARRQQREAERRRREAMQGRGTTGGEQQRQLAEQAEEEARRLEQLSREQDRPELAEAARRLQDAAEAMRRSASGQGSEQEAMDRLREAQRSLERSQDEALRREAEDVARRAGDMAREQARLRREAEALAGGEAGAERQERAERLAERKAEQLEELDQLQQDMRRLGDRAGTEQPEAARRLRDAARAVDETNLRTKIDYSRQYARVNAPEQFVRDLEAQIEEDLREIEERLEGIGESFQPAGREPEEEALEDARDLARGLESMRQRGQEAREQASGNPNGGGGLDPSAVRQYRSEAGQRAEDARELRERMRGQGMDTGRVDDLIRGIDRMRGSDIYGDPEELARLQEALADQAKRLELVLRIQAAGGDAERIFQAGADAVPEEYRELVEAYYRSLSADRGG